MKRPAFAVIGVAITALGFAAALQVQKEDKERDAISMASEVYINRDARDRQLPSSPAVIADIDKAMIAQNPVVSTGESFTSSSPSLRGGASPRGLTTTPPRSAISPARGSNPESRRLDSAASVDEPVLEVELGPGMRAPIAFVPTNESTPQVVAAAKEEIAKEFEREVLQATEAQDPKPEQIGEVWNEAQLRADQRLRLLFGKTAFEQESLRSVQSPAR